VNVPAAVVDLHEARAPLQEPARQETTVGKGAAAAGLLAVEAVGAGRFVHDIDQVRHRRLHAEGHLVLRDAGLRLGVAEALVVHLVELVESVEHVAAQLVVHAGRVVEVQHRAAAGAQRDAGVLRREEAGAPQPGEIACTLAAGLEWLALSTTKVGKFWFMLPKP